MKDTASFVSEITNDNNPQEIKLTDKIEYKCSHCGNCCINSQSRLLSFDIYNMQKYYKPEWIIDRLDFYHGNESYFPLVMIKNNKNGMCPFLKNANGDFICSLKNDKPLMCSHPFIAIGTTYNNEFSFVPIGEKVKKTDVNKFVKENAIQNSQLYLLKEVQERQCPTKKKEEILLSEHLKDRILHDEEMTLSSLPLLLLQKYIDMKMFTKIIYLSENTKLEVDLANQSSNMYSRILKSLYNGIYLFANPDKPFKEQILKQIENLEDKVFPTLRILYEHLFNVYNVSDTILYDIINLEDEELAQERFDSYFMNHREEIKERFIKEAVEMMIEMQKIKGDAL